MRLAENLAIVELYATGKLLKKYNNIQDCLKSFFSRLRSIWEVLSRQIWNVHFLQIDQYHEGKGHNQQAGYSMAWVIYFIQHYSNSQRFLSSSCEFLDDYMHIVLVWQEMSIIRVIWNEGRRETGKRHTNMHGEVSGHSRIKHPSVVSPVDSPGKRSHATLQPWWHGIISIYQNPLNVPWMAAPCKGGWSRIEFGGCKRLTFEIRKWPHQASQFKEFSLEFVGGLHPATQIWALGTWSDRALL